MGKAKRFNSYDDAVAQKRKVIEGYAQARQERAGISSSFRQAPQPPIFTPTSEIAASTPASGIAFPVRYPVDNQGSKGGVTVTHDMSAVTAHDLKFTATGAVTLSFTNYPASGTGIDWYVEITQDGTGGHAITWPSEVAPVPTVSTAADATTRISLHTDDGGTIVVPVFLGTASAGAGEVFTWTANHNANGNDLIGVSNVRFDDTGGANPTIANIYSDISSNLVYNVPTGDFHVWTENDVTLAELNNGEFEVRTVNEDGPDLLLVNNDQTPTNNDVVGQIFFKGNADDLSSNNWGSIEFEQNNVATASKQGSYKVSCQSDNTLQPIIDYSGSDGVFRFSSGVDVVRPNADNVKDLGASAQSWKDFYIAGFQDVKGISTPSNPASGTRRIFTDSGTGELSIRTNGGSTVSLEGGGLGTHNLLNSSAHPDTTTGTVARGDLITGQTSTPEWTRLVKGTANQVLTMDGTGTDIIWANAAAGDDLGNHTATEALKMATFDIENTGVIKLASSSAIGGTDVGLSQTTGDMYLNCLTSDSFFFREQGTTVVEIDADGIDIRSPGWLEMTELSSAPTGLSNHVRIYAEDNGAGKTRLMAQFGTGAAQQLAIEP